MTRFFLTLCLLLCALPCAASPARYRITPLPGFHIWGGNAYLNNAGMAACGDKVWQNGKTWTIRNPLHDKHYRTVEIGGINDAGTVTGTFSGVQDGAWLVSFGRVFRWHSGRTTLLPPKGDAYLKAESINSKGDILVHYYLQFPQPSQEVMRGFLFHKGHYQSLRAGNALKMNEQGQFVTEVEDRDDEGYPGYAHYFLWSRRKLFPITPTPALVPGGGGRLSINGLNDSGAVIGRAAVSSVGITGFVWQAGKFTNLQAPTGYSSDAFGINNGGQVVGSFSTGANDKRGYDITRAFLWQNGRMTDLNTLLPARSGWVFTEADAINDRGQIVCAGNKGACLLTPITIKHRRL